MRGMWAMSWAESLFFGVVAVVAIGSVIVAAPFICPVNPYALAFIGATLVMTAVIHCASRTL